MPGTQAKAGSRSLRLEFALRHFRHRLWDPCGSTTFPSHSEGSRSWGTAEPSQDDSLEREGCRLLTFLRWWIIGSIWEADFYDMSLAHHARFVASHSVASSGASIVHPMTSSGAKSHKCAGNERFCATR